MNPPTPSPQLPPRPPAWYRWHGVVLGPVEKLLGITCREFTRLASDRLDRRLKPGERLRYWVHRLICDICRRQDRRLRQLNALAGAALRGAHQDSTVQLDATVRERIRERLRQELRKP